MSISERRGNSPKIIHFHLSFFSLPNCLPLKKIINWNFLLTGGAMMIYSLILIKNYNSRRQKFFLIITFKDKRLMLASENFKFLLDSLMFSEMLTLGGQMIKIQKFV